MSALPLPEILYRPMLGDDLDIVLAIENSIYDYPWSEGNFQDSLDAGHHCWILEIKHEIAGYGVMMLGAREAHLLNLSVAGEWQRQGLGRSLLKHFVSLARALYAEIMILEVRPSNSKAQALYEDFGFGRIGIRRGYYPAGDGREDAMVMNLKL
ncbi:MAG: ribosomal protein S18-alanine N-acetyltransferase [Burkholderiales bacterium]